MAIGGTQSGDGSSDRQSSLQGEEEIGLEGFGGTDSSRMRAGKVKDARGRIQGSCRPVRPSRAADSIGASHKGEPEKPMRKNWEFVF